MMNGGQANYAGAARLLKGREEEGVKSAIDVVKEAPEEGKCWRGRDAAGNPSSPTGV